MRQRKKERLEEKEREAWGKGTKGAPSFKIGKGIGKRKIQIGGKVVLGAQWR